MASSENTRSSDDKVLVIFIHGLNGGVKSWRPFNLTLSSIAESHEKFDVKYYEYPTSFVDIFLRPLPKIQTIADGLRSFISLNCKKYSKIILACHSMGGLVARKYLLNQIKNFKHEVLQVKVVLLYATPNLGSELASVSFLNPWHKQINQLRTNSDFIEELNTDWDYFGLKGSTKVKYVLAGRDNIVQRSSAVHYWGNASVLTDVSKSHFDIIEPSGHEDISLRILIDEINEQYEMLINPEDIQDDSLDSETDFESNEA